MSENLVEIFIEAINTEDVDAAISLIQTSGLVHSNNWLNRYKFLESFVLTKDDDNNQCNSDDNLLRLMLHRASKGFVNKMFRRAVKNRFTIIASFLLEDVPNKINVNAYGEDGKTALHAAICYGSTSLVYILLDHDADIHAQPTEPSDLNDDRNEDWENTIGKSTLHLAAEFGDSKMIEILLACGADVHATDTAGSTCLHLSWNSWDRVKIASVLVKAGANFNMKDNLGRTPLHVAAMRQHDVTFIESLLEHGADVNITCNDDMTPLGYVALADGHRRNIVSVLKKHIIAMRVLDLYVSDGNLKYIDLNGKDRHTFEECKKQLAAKICSSNISFYDFLTGSTKQLMVYLRDKNLCEALEKITGIGSICCKDHRMNRCPLYQNMIVARYNHGKERKLLLRWGSESFKIALFDLFGKELPEDIVLKVVEYCSNEQLNHLINSVYGES